MNGEGNGNPLQYFCLEDPVDRGAWGAAVHRVAQSRTRLKQLCMHACTEEGNGNPLQCSCLENPRDEGAWWAAVSGVTQSRTRLMRLSTNSNHVPVTGLIALHALSHRSLKTTHEFGFIIILILHMTKLRLQEINTGHIASK